MRGREYPERPWTAVGVIVFRDDQVLLVKRGTPPFLGAWSIPGGAQHLGETAETAARRELLEEAGIEVGSLTITTIADLIQADPDGGIRLHYTILDFAARWSAGELRAGDDVSEARWFSAPDLFGLELDQAILAAIDDAWRRLHDLSQMNNRSFSNPA